MSREDDPLGEWTTTQSGIIHLFNPQLDEINIRDIAHQLSMICRFGGACNEFYSVAQHSFWVSRLCSEENKLWGLLHDASEAYLGDVVRPLKRDIRMSAYREAEHHMMYTICRKFGLPTEMPDEVKKNDNIMLVSEGRDLMRDPSIIRTWEVKGDPRTC